MSGIWRFIALAGFFAVTAAPAAAADLVALAGPSHLKANKVVVYKSKRSLQLLSGDRVIRTYRIALGRNPKGMKMREGDGRTPEGRYTLDWRNSDSRFHRSIHISYPADRDLARSREYGVEPGGNIMIHGLPENDRMLGETHYMIDWTEGCIAVTNKEIEEIWRLVDDGTPIVIHP